MSEHLIKQLEEIVRGKFYEEYNIDVVDHQYIVRGGVVIDAGQKKKRGKHKDKKRKYCATGYMKIDKEEKKQV